MQFLNRFRVPKASELRGLEQRLIAGDFGRQLAHPRLRGPKSLHDFQVGNAAGGVAFLPRRGWLISDGDLFDLRPVEEPCIVVPRLDADPEEADADLRRNDLAPDRALK